VSNAAALSEENIKNFVAAWYNALDIHAPVEQCLEFLAEDVEMNFPPDPPFTGYEGFRKWYVDIIIKTFFDENHNVASVEIANQTESQAELNIVVAWQASWFRPTGLPQDAKSHRTSMDAFQKWVIRPTEKRGALNTFGLEVISYNAAVQPFEYAHGFARL
jgi:hypothetical protein